MQEIGLRGASPELNIPRKYLQRWSKQTELLEEAALYHDSSIKTQSRFGKNNPTYPLLEEELMNHIKEEREKRNVVTGKNLRRNLYPGDKSSKSPHGWLRVRKVEALTLPLMIILKN